MGYLDDSHTGDQPPDTGTFRVRNVAPRERSPTAGAGSGDEGPYLRGVFVVVLEGLLGEVPGHLVG